MTLEEFQKKYGKEIAIEWIIGGVRGGSCWDDGGIDRHYALDSEREPDFPIDEIIEKYNPNISYMNYKKLLKNIIYKEIHDYEYYGNYTNYATKTLDTKILYEILFLK